MSQKRLVSPETSVRNFPTPDINDLLVVVDVDSRLPGYQPQEYGTLHPDQTRYPNAKLVYQAPIDGLDQFVRRVYATDRVNQDAYNYAIKYSGESNGHPVYIRSYVELREKYAPEQKGSADPLNPEAQLISEEAAPAEGDLNSLYVQVTRVYETLPGPVITSLETNEVGQKVVVTSQRKSAKNYELPDATALTVPTATAESVNVVTEQTRTLPFVFDRKQFSAERPDPLPVKFRAAVPDIETSAIIEGDAQQPTLQVPQDLSASESQETLFLKRVSRRLRPDPEYPVVFTETTRTNSGQIATVTSVLQPFIQLADSGPTVESSEVSDLGDGRSIKITTEVDELFEQPEFTRSKDDLTPVKFRASVSETVVERTVPGVAELPDSLGPDEISKSESQLTVDRKRVRVQERSLVESGQLNELIITPDGQLATRTLTLADGPQSIQPSATLVGGEVEQLGDGRTVKTEVAVDEVFDERRVSAEKPDLVPAEFRGAIPTQTEEEVVAGVSVTMPQLAPGDLAKSQQRITDHKVRTSTVSRQTTALPANLTDTLVDNEGVLVTRLKTLAATAQTISPSATVSGQVENLGDGLTLRTQDTRAEVFSGQLLAVEGQDTAPAKFRTAVPTVTEETTVPGVVTTPQLTGPGQLAKSEQQVTKFTKRTRQTTRSTTALPKSLTQKATNERLQLASVTETLQVGDTNDVPTALTSVESEALGDGTYVVRKTTLPSVFPAKSFSREKPDPAPQKFRVELPLTIVEETTAGQAAPITLAPDEVSKSEQQLTEFTKRTSVASRTDAPSGTLLGEQTGTWGVEAVTETYDANGTIAPGYTVLSAKKTPLGGGKFLGERVVVNSPVTLQEARIDADTGIQFSITKSLVQAGTALPTVQNGSAEIVPIDAWNSIQIITSVTGLPAAETYETTIDMSYPDELLEIGVLWEDSKGGAGFASGFVDIAKIVQDDLNWNGRAKAEAFAQVIGNVYVKIKDGHRGKVRAAVSRTYHNGPPGGTVSATAFRPVRGTVVITGKSLKESREKNVSGKGSTSIARDGGGDFKVQTFANSVTFGPVVHSGPSLVGFGTRFVVSPLQTASAGSLPGGGMYPVTSAQGEAVASAVLQLPASSTPISSGGSHVALVRVEKWRFGVWIKEVYTAYHP